MKSILLLLASAAVLLPLRADPWTDAFSFESIPIPAGIDPQIGGIGVLSDGRLAVCFHRGEILIYDPAAQSWSPFASGLHEPLGIVVESDSSLLVMQRPELTRLSDTDADGLADSYETVFDDFGMTGNYHEFAFGPVRAADGNLFVALNVASNGAGIRKEIRGEWSPIGLERGKMTEPGGAWGRIKEQAGRMYSRVPYRGWVMRISPDGKEITPWASGLRSPDGIGLDAEGRLLVTDNQGDWRGTSPLHEVRQGEFCGHPASLVWKPGWTRDPLDLPVSELEEMRAAPMGLFPQGELANSPTQPIAIPAGTFGPLAGQTLIGEMNQTTLIRFLADPVDGIAQGAALPFLRTKALGIGNHRLAFTPDGSLWIGKTHLAWAGEQGLLRVRAKTDTLFVVRGCTLLENGFSLRFTQPVDPATLGSIKARRHTYKYHKEYGSPKVDEKGLPVLNAVLGSDGLELTLELDGLKEGFLHTLDLSGVRSLENAPLLGEIVYYQLNRLR